MLTILERAASRLFLSLLVLLSFAGIAAGQRANLDTGWVPSVEYTNTPADYSADVFAITSCSDASCTSTLVAPRLQYRYRVTVRNTTGDWHTTSGSWLTFFWLFNAPGEPAGNTMAAQGCGVPEFFALLAPNDGQPGGPDEATFEVTRTFTLADGVTSWVLPAAQFAANVRAPGALPAHRLWVRPTHWWNLTVDGQGVPAGAHWPVAVTVENAEARLTAQVTHQ